MRNCLPIKNNFCTAYPTDSKNLYGKALKTFCTEFVAPENSPLTVPKSKMKIVREFETIAHVIERSIRNQNRVEGVIHETRKKWYRIMLRKNYLEDYGIMVLDGFVR